MSKQKDLLKTRYQIPIRAYSLAVSKVSSMPLHSTCHMPRVGWHKHITFNRNNIIQRCKLSRVADKWCKLLHRCYSFLRA